MSGISSRLDAVKLINSDEQTPDDEDARFELRCVACGRVDVSRETEEEFIHRAHQVANEKDIVGSVALFTGDGTFTDESREVVYRGPERAR